MILWSMHAGGAGVIEYGDLELDALGNAAQPMKADERIRDVVRLPKSKDQPRSRIENLL